MAARPPSRGETSTTLGVGPRRRQPTTPERRERRMGDGRIRPHPPPHTITRQRMRCQSNRRNSCHIISDDVNVMLLQYAPNLLNILHIHAGNADTALDLAITVLNNFKLKRDTVRTENDLPAQ